MQNIENVVPQRDRKRKRNKGEREKESDAENKKTIWSQNIINFKFVKARRACRTHKNK